MALITLRVHLPRRVRYDARIRDLKGDKYGPANDPEFASSLGAYFRSASGCSSGPSSHPRPQRPHSLHQQPAADGFVAWSPNSAQLAFSTDRTGQLEVFKMNASDGSGLVNLTKHPSFDAFPTW
jgi:hypothetical protein